MLHTKFCRRSLKIGPVSICRSFGQFCSSGIPQHSFNVCNHSINGRYLQKYLQPLVKVTVTWVMKCPLLLFYCIEIEKCDTSHSLILFPINNDIAWSAKLTYLCRPLSDSFLIARSLNTFTPEHFWLCKPFPTDHFKWEETSLLRHRF